jgi:hypothetical protein
MNPAADSDHPESSNGMVLDASSGDHALGEPLYPVPQHLLIERLVETTLITRFIGMT